MPGVEGKHGTYYIMASFLNDWSAIVKICKAYPLHFSQLK